MSKLSEILARVNGTSSVVESEKPGRAAPSIYGYLDKNYSVSSKNSASGIAGKCGIVVFEQPLSGKEKNELGNALQEEGIIDPELEDYYLSENGKYFFYVEVSARRAKNESKEDGECPIEKVEKEYGSLEDALNKAIDGDEKAAKGLKKLLKDIKDFKPEDCEEGECDDKEDKSDKKDDEKPADDEPKEDGKKDEQKDESYNIASKFKLSGGNSSAVLSEAKKLVPTRLASVKLESNVLTFVPVVNQVAAENDVLNICRKYGVQAQYVVSAKGESMDLNSLIAGGFKALK